MGMGICYDTHIITDTHTQIPDFLSYFTSIVILDTQCEILSYKSNISHLYALFKTRNSFLTFKIIRLCDCNFSIKVRSFETIFVCVNVQKIFQCHYQQKGLK